MTRKLPPVHPGEILLKDFLEPLGISQYRLPPRRINEIVLGTRAVTADTALRLGRFFGMESEFWLNLQSRFELETTDDRLAGRLKTEVRPLAA